MQTRLHIRRFTLEALSPLLISGGDDDPLLDNVLARDANGLPMLPATGIAGALRARMDPACANAYFGYQDGDEGARSPLTLTDALFHWSDNKPRDGLVLDLSKIRQDKVASFALQDSPVKRDHVRLNEYGVADGNGKFIRSAAPRGSRFTFEISQWGDGKALDTVADLIREGLSLGGATRSGYGEMACIAEGRADLDLSSDKDWETYEAIARADLGNSPIDMVEVGPAEQKRTPGWRIEGRIEGPLITGGAPWEDEDRAPYREHFIAWENGEGRVAGPVPVLPASAIKGPLRHRTLFHLRKSDPENAEVLAKDLFGSERKDAEGHAGRLRFFEIVLAGSEEIRLTHVGIDRFTGGARKGVLFTDRMLWRPALTIEIAQLGAIPKVAQDAFEKALADLKSGLLGIGADWGDGAGIF
ncbi:MAG TPA: hypothetical protein ENJ52_11635, partial [Aliiroseovarius sp.]|nr:hypothetical protein [Aliiroseovarius sp.]